MKKLTDNQEKLDIVSKLVKEGAIQFQDAIKLLEIEEEQPIFNPLLPYDFGGNITIPSLYPNVLPPYAPYPYAPNGTGNLPWIISGIGGTCHSSDTLTVNHTP